MWSRTRWSVSNRRRLNSRAYQSYLARQADLIVRLGRISRESQVLELGSYPGLLGPHLMERCSLILSDTSTDLLEERYEGCRYIEARGEDIPLDDASLDVLFMIDVFHHLLDFKAFEGEACRVLKPDGRLIVFEAKKRHPLVMASNLLHGRAKEPYGLALSIDREFVTKILSERFALCESTTFRSFLGFKIVLLPNCISHIVDRLEGHSPPMHDVLVFRPILAPPSRLGRLQGTGTSTSRRA